MAAAYCVGRLGDAAIAGYGIASCLDLTFISLLYGAGISILAMVGANLGAGVRGMSSGRTGWPLSGRLWRLRSGALSVVHFSEDTAVLPGGESSYKVAGIGEHAGHGVAPLGCSGLLKSEGVARGQDKARCRA